MRTAIRNKLPWLLALTLLLAGCGLDRQYEAALVLADIAAQQRPSALKRRTAAPQRTLVPFSVAGRAYRGDLYRPASGALAGLLLIPGAAEEGKDDPRLVALATTLARARFAVLVPDLESLRRLQVHPGNVGEVRDAFAWLAAQPELAPGGRAGMAAFSYAAGPALLAAREPQIRDRVAFILALGGYYDLPRVLTFFTTGYFPQGGELRYLQPNAYGKWVFVRSNLGRLADPSDRRLLQGIADRKLRDLEAPVDDLAGRLGPEGARLYAFVSNSDPQRAPALLAGLPPGVREDIAALDLAGKDLAPLRARLLLLHGIEDAIIPYVESQALAAALPPGQARLFLAKGLAHVDLQPGLYGRWQLWRAVAALLAERDGARD